MYVVELPVVAREELFAGVREGMAKLAERDRA
jgi:hypothetical protein